MVYHVKPQNYKALQKGHLHLGGRNETEELQVTSRYLVRNGEPWIPVAGEMHYARLPARCWEEELLKMKAGGVTVVSSYVFWNYHEAEEGVFCFDGNLDLRRFVRTVAGCGLSMILRIGPWIHGEVRNGGFPDWLLDRNIPLRQNSAEYLAYVKRFYQKIYEQVEEFLFWKGGTIWAVQLENELTDQPEHLRKLRELAEETGLRVPVYTVTGWNSEFEAQIPAYDVLPVFGGYPEAPWEDHTERLQPNLHYFFQPDRNDSCIGDDLLPKKEVSVSPELCMDYGMYPYATCELGGGLHTSYRRRPVIGSDDVAAIALVKLGCGNNMPGFYMYHGGVNALTDHTMQESKATGYPNDYPILNYDFQAPVGAWGQIRESYRKFRLQNLFVLRFGSLLAPMMPLFQTPPIEDRWDGTNLRYCVRTDGESGFVFVNNYQRLTRLPEHRDVQFEVPCGDKSLVFPEHGLTIPTGAYFCLPYNLRMGGITLNYATAQLLYEKDNAWFFFSPFDTEAEYSLTGRDGGGRLFRAECGEIISDIDSGGGQKLRIVTLSREQAEHFCAIDGQIYLSAKADIYSAGGQIVVRGEGCTDLSYALWNGEEFEWHTYYAEDRSAEAAVSEITAPVLPAYCGEGMFLSPGKRVQGYAVDLPAVFSEEIQEAYLDITYTGDVLQIYMDGRLAADEFYKDGFFRVGLRELSDAGTHMEIWISELEEGKSYLESEVSCGLELRKAEVTPVYKRYLPANIFAGSGEMNCQAGMKRTIGGTEHNV